MQKHEDLKAARHLSGLNQEQAALAAGVSRETFNRWENGKQPLPDPKFYKFLRATGITPQDIMEYFTRLPLVRTYDVDGYPEGFSKKARGAASLKDEDEAYTASLIKAEGAEFVDREVERARIALAAIYGANQALFEEAWNGPEGAPCSKAAALLGARLDYSNSLC